MNSRLTFAALILSSPLLMAIPGLAADPPAVPLDFSTPLKQEMREVYGAYRGLQRFLGSRDQFVDSANDEQIKAYLNQLGGHFHVVEDLSKKYTNEPGFITTLKSIEEMLRDTEARFREGKKSYALWRVRSASEYCITCHTRFKISVGFMAGDDKLENLTPIQKANFLLATRQFDKARKILLDSIINGKESVDTIDLLRKLLLVHTRVSPDPAGALKEFNAVLALGKLTPYEKEEVEGWVESLRAWKKDIKRPLTLESAEELVKHGILSADPLSPRKGTVELLRGTAMLHRLLDGNAAVPAEERRRAMYLLGLSYSELPPLFVDSLAEQFLEQCIRDYPSTEDARRSYKLFDRLVRLSFTGSGGENIPADVTAELRELHNLAYGVPGPLGKV